MGNHYTNLTLACADRDAVAAALREAGRDAFLSSIDHGAVVVFDDVHDRTCGLELGELSALLSERLTCAALAVRNADDSAFEYELYVQGRCVDRYEASPRGIEGGSADVLLRVFGGAARRDELEAVLRGNYATQTDRHDALVRLLRLPSAAAGLGYEDLDRDPTLSLDAGGDFLRIVREAPARQPAAQPSSGLAWSVGNSIPSLAGVAVRDSREAVFAKLGTPDRTNTLGPGFFCLSYRRPGLEILVTDASGVTGVAVSRRDGPDLYGAHVGDAWTSVQGRWGGPDERWHSSVGHDVIYLYHLGAAWTVHVELDRREERVLRLALGSSLRGVQRTGGA